MLAEIEALVGRVDDDRVVRLARIFQPVEHAAHAVVHCGDRAEIFVHVALVFPDRHLPVAHISGVHGIVAGLERAEIGLALFGGHAREIVGPGIEAQFAAPLLDRHLQIVPLIHVAIDVHFLRRGGGASVVMVEIIGRHGKFRADIFLHMAKGGHEIAVRRLVVDQQGERLVAARPPVEPGEAAIGDEVGGIAFDHAASVGRDDVGIVVFALIVEHGPIVDPRAFGRVIEVPFPEQGGVVARRP